ncbi:MAG: hypothetical protein AAGB46_08575 [Verrucomicrobiota bacterium]
MNLKAWAIKLRDLKQLSRTGLLSLGYRCALRVEPWIPPDSAALWNRGLEYVVKSIRSGVNDSSAGQLTRQLSDCGAIACNETSRIDETLGRCMNYATLTLALTIDATSIKEDKELKKVIIDIAKHSASIPAILGHANRVVAPTGEDPVDHASISVWDLIRADIQRIEKISDMSSIKDLRDLRDIWADGGFEWCSQ